MVSKFIKLKLFFIKTPNINRDIIAKDKNISGNAYINKNLRVLPKTLYESIENMKKSDIPVKLFGKEFVSHFIKTREWECAKFRDAVTNWELKRYFEII